MTILCCDDSNSAPADRPGKRSRGEYGPVYPMAIGDDSTWSDNRWEDGPNAGQEIARPE